MACCVQLGFVVQLASRMRDFGCSLYSDEGILVWADRKGLKAGERGPAWIESLLDVKKQN